MIHFNFKKILFKFRALPLHPQWFVYKDTHVNYSRIGQTAKGTVLDIGCADQFIRQYLVQTKDYIGLDYYQTALEWYATRPQVFGDAQCLPFSDCCIDTVLLLDVLEHLPRPQDGLAEIARVLRPNGILILQVPFLYPLHDVPLDFQRWTGYGLKHLADKHGFRIIEQNAFGSPMETAGLLMNIALSKTLFNWLEQKHPALILGFFIPLTVLLVNLLCWLLDLLSPNEAMMPHSYFYILEKSA